jgi:DNA-binding MarR family transcriptional regulator
MSEWRIYEFFKEGGYHRGGGGGGNLEASMGSPSVTEKVVGSLAPEEKQAFKALTSEHQREGFLIVRAFAGVAEHKKEKDFPISRASLADRLSLTPPGAAGVIRKLCELKIIDRTQCPVTHKESARYCWLLPRGKASQSNQLNYAPATSVTGARSFDSLSAVTLGAQADMPQLSQVAGAFGAD